MQCIENVYVFTKENCFLPGTVWIDGEKISRVELAETECLSGEFQKTDSSDGKISVQTADVYDGHGMYLIPGMIDLHFHGCLEHDFSDGTMEAIDEIARFELAHGVTSICPATLTLPVDRLEQILKTAVQYRKWQENYTNKTEKYG